MDLYISVVLERASFENIDNDKFSFTPRPLTDNIDVIVKQASV